MATLKPARHLVASLISSLPPTQENASSNPLRDASPESQKALLALHVLFPNELLPALDLLDRGLVTRFTLAGHENGAPAAVHHVRSAQHASSHRHREQPTTGTYEVRLASWNCSCPAFAFAAFPADAEAAAAAGIPVSDIPVERRAEDGLGGADWSFGGLTRGTDMLVCKHLLACVLVEHSEMFRSFAEERQVSVEELAGWAAGWGD